MQTQVDMGSQAYVLDIAHCGMGHFATWCALIHEVLQGRRPKSNPRSMLRSRARAHGHS